MKAMNNIDIDKLQMKMDKCKNLSFDDIDINKVKDLSEIKINRRKSSNERILDFLNSVEYPYIFKVGGKLVKIEFSKNDKTAEECITNVIKSIYQ